jgi:glycosyltransferase involved in cell wall biosynthesis
VRLVTVFHYPVYGGPQNQAAQLNASLLSAGVHTVAVLPPEGVEAAARLQACGVDVVMLSLHRLRATWQLRLQAPMLAALPREVAGLRRLIRNVHADVVQVNGLVNPHAALAARLEGRAVVWQIQDTVAPQWLRIACMPQVLALADVVMTTGTTVMRGHPGIGALGPRAVHYYPPVDTELFRPRPEERALARARLGVANEHRVVVAALGNVTAQKGHEFALRAVAASVNEGNDVCLRVLGARSANHQQDEARLLGEAAALGMLDDGRFAIIEPGRELSSLLNGVDVGVLSALPRSEGVPTMVLEAMAGGVPVIATDVGGVSEAIRSGVDGIVVEPLQVDKIAAEIGRLAMDRNLRARMGFHARRTVLNRFAVVHSTRSHLLAYQIAVDRRACRARQSNG